LQENKEISALFHLIDDPDEEVYGAISEKILSFGKGIIPNLEHLWENTTDSTIQERIENIIHRLHFRDLCDDFTDWKNGSTNLLTGALLVARYHYPDMQEDNVLKELEKIRRNTWLELNTYLTPLEQVNIVSGILYNYSKLKGVEIAYNNPDDFLINKVLESKRGNAVSNGIIYLILCELLDIPVRCINIPRQFIVGYMDAQVNILNPGSHPADSIKFFIDPVNGQVYSHKDVENYFKRIAVPPTPSYYKPRNNKQIIQYLIEDFAKCFDNTNNAYKMQELLSIINLLEE
jgi:regulator of sirC expression with transglutaminase-like and TPR domain